MAYATFHNITDKPFTAYWNGHPKTVKPGERLYMESYLAAHFAKHLTNQILIEAGKENYTSPKYPEQVPQFMEVFSKCYIPEQEAEGANELEASIAAMQPKGPSSNAEMVKPTPIVSGSAAAAASVAGPGSEAQIINPPAGDDEEFDLPPAGSNQQ